jgi:trehalose/maltose hydrolase-like predicted phosphorylase
MEELEVNTIMKIRIINVELEVTNKIQIYLEQVKEQADVLRLMQFFETVFEDLAA